MRTSFTSAISLPRFHDSCVPVCISFLISSVSSLGVCLLSSGASLRSSFLISSVPSLGICLNFFYFILFIYCFFYFLLLFFYPCLIPLFLAKGSPPPPPPRCQMAVHRTVPHSGPSRPFPNLTPLFWSFGSIHALALASNQALVCTPSFKPDVHSRIAATSKQKSRLERRPSSNQ